MANLLKWWIVATITFLATGLAYYLGILDMLYVKDKSHLAIIVVAAINISTIALGFVFARNQDPKNPPNLEPFWFIAERMLSAGLMGTVLGFILMFGDNFDKLGNASQDPNVLKEVIVAMAAGVSTALYATLAGLVGEFILKTQLVIIEAHYEESE